MKKSVFSGCLALLCLGWGSLAAQYRVTFLVSQPSVLHSMDHIYLTGNFNMWNPADSAVVLQPSASGISSVTVSLPAGDYEYKFTRGSWQKGETDANGQGIGNRTLALSSDTTVRVTIAGWNDDFKQNQVAAARKHTASPNVSIIDTGFYMPELKRTRRIWVYLPPGYKTSGKKYPVLYMQDGQNLFDDATSYSGEWGVDEYLDSLQAEGGKDVIVVGVDNGRGKRMTEYNPWEFQNFGKGEGDQYVDFIVQNLKPFIDARYRTIKSKPGTFIAGSSMGGLISLYAVLKYPSVFGGAGIFSPAFWTASGIDSAVIADARRVDSRLFFYAGGMEGDAMIPDMKRIEKELRDRSKSALKEVIDDAAHHNETAWRKWFPAFYEWTIIGK